MSSKNILQELFPQSPPTYQTTKIGGSAHDPQFRSTVLLADGRSFQGLVQGNRIGAEKSAASEAIKILLPSGNTPSGKKILNATIPTVMFIDLENISNGAQSIESGKNMTILGFLRYDHPLVEKKDLYSFPLLLAHSVNKDACDTYIVMKIMEYILFKKPQKIVIVTRDHFAHTFKDLIHHDYPGLKVEVIFSFEKEY